MGKGARASVLRLFAFRQVQQHMCREFMIISGLIGFYSLTRLRQSIHGCRKHDMNLLRLLWCSESSHASAVVSSEKALSSCSFSAGRGGGGAGSLRDLVETLYEVCYSHGRPHARLRSAGPCPLSPALTGFRPWALHAPPATAKLDPCAAIDLQRPIPLTL